MKLQDFDSSRAPCRDTLRPSLFLYRHPVKPDKLSKTQAEITWVQAERMNASIHLYENMIRCDKNFCLSSSCLQWLDEANSHISPAAIVFQGDP
jgi:hypothetical protein